MGTYVGAAAQDSDRLAADRAWVRWGVAAAVTGMLVWVIAVALIPPDAKLEKGEQHLVQVMRAHTGQGYAAALLTPARRFRGGRDHRRAGPAHHRHLDPRSGRHTATIAADGRHCRLRNRRVTKTGLSDPCPAHTRAANLL